MPKIIDYLAVQDTVLSFQVNTALDFVASLPFALDSTNGQGKKIFSSGDSFILLAYGVMLPENFTYYLAGYGPPSVMVYGMELPGLLGFHLPVFKPAIAGSYAPDLLVLEENREFDVEGFCDYSQFKLDVNQQKVTGGFTLQIAINPCYISMLNVPAAANNKTYRITPFIKVAHNIPLL